jgi:hypothetical protein
VVKWEHDKEGEPMTTRNMGRSLLVMSLAAALAVPGSGRHATAQQQTVRQAQIPGGWRFTLPSGDPLAGEAVFVRMKCGACHNVEGRDTGSAGQQAGAVGPDLTRAQAQLPAEFVAERLITADRFLPHGMFHATYSRSDGSSRMGNYNEEMSVKELIDLVAFLQSIGTPPR